MNIKELINYVKDYPPETLVFVDECHSCQSEAVAVQVELLEKHIVFACHKLFIGPNP